MAIKKDLPKSYPGTTNSKVAKLVPVPGFPGMLTDDKNPQNPKDWGLNKKNYKETPSPNLPRWKVQKGKKSKKRKA